MSISVIKQTRLDERRVPMVPAGAHLLTQRGHQVYIEHNAGMAAGFNDEDYLTAGAKVVYSHAEAVGRAELVLGVAPFEREDVDLMVPGQTVMSFGHLVTLSPEALHGMCDKSITAVAYEWIENDANRRPIVEVMGEIAGPLALSLAARLLELPQGGRGILLSGLPGVPAAQVVVIGGGTVGMAAVRAAIGMGAQVVLFDSDPERLRLADHLFERRVVTYLSYRYDLERALRHADVVIGAVWVHGGKPPILITREMVQSMKPRSVIVDCSIDQGGICATGRPTTLSDPTYVAEGVIHCCIPNMPAAVARTASFALANALFPYVRNMAEGGLSRVLSDQPRFGAGIYLRDGRVVHPAVGILAEMNAATVI
ncbi:MAG: alanine dehydrogenase [candidate division Zixibacteria bacterium]|nr:alanine dehydrogenase [candidate division Zixibacteria bacterium]